MTASCRPLIAVWAEMPDFRKDHGTCDEDRSPVRCGHIPHVLAALRHTVIGLMRWAGQTTMAAACRRFAAEPSAALALIGLELENCMTLLAGYLG